MQLYHIPDTYVILDLETTGLSPEKDQIIEIGALFIKAGQLKAKWNSLICPDFSLLENESLSSHTEALTHITREMLLSALPLETKIASLLDFLGDYPIAGHRVDFDISFLNASLQKMGFASIQNDFFDTLLLSQRLLPELLHHKLGDLASYYRIDYSGAHRALRDCEITWHCLKAMEKTAQLSFSSKAAFERHWEFGSRRITSEEFETQTSSFDESHPFYGKNVAITGILFTLSRRAAMQKVANLGGINQDKVNTFTDFLICGKGEGSTKEKKALRLKTEGYPIQLLSEEEFLNL
ncbi:MAG: exonuclease domain-containing protein [Acetivibrio ethanolgignens]